MIELTPDEVNAFNIISQQAVSLQNQLTQTQAAQRAMVSLLEIKYNATFNDKTGQLEPKPKEKEDKK